MIYKDFASNRWIRLYHRPTDDSRMRYETPTCKWIVDEDIRMSKWKEGTNMQ